jgi:hypothetical protein
MLFRRAKSHPGEAMDYAGFRPCGELNRRCWLAGSYDLRRRADANAGARQADLNKKQLLGA